MKELIIVGLGPGSMEHLSCGVRDILRNGQKIFFRTARHPVVGELAAQGLTYEAFDRFYEKRETFAQVYQDIADHLLATLREEKTDGPVIYGVPGHPLVGEESVFLLLEQARAAGVRVTIKAGMSFIDNIITTLELDPTKGFVVLDALAYENRQVTGSCHLIFTQVYSRLVASDLKLSLLEVYPHDHPVVIVRAAGIAGAEKIIRAPLYELDHGDHFDHLTSVYVSPRTSEQHPVNRDSRYPLDPLVDVMEKLLSPEGCPWDRQQDHFSLKPYLLEEVYEVIEAIDSKDMHKLEEELGDLLLQIVFHAMLAQKRGDFTNNDVIETITKKMIHRHPHVFGDISVKTAEEVLVNWEKIKAGEKETPQTGSPAIMGNLNKALPALILAEETQKRARKVGFDWNDVAGAWDKLFEEINELKEAYREKINVEEEIGDLLFAVVNIARFAGISPEVALINTVHKFIRRFNYIEQHIVENGGKWEDKSLAYLDDLWEKAKKDGL